MGKGRILVIDDEEFFRNIYEDILSSLGFSVASVENGRKGLDLFKKDGFDVVITDLTMPDWDGIKTIEEIRKVNPSQDIVVVTNISDLEMIAAAMRAGASDYIMKPLQEGVLIQTLRKLLKRQKILYEHSKLVKENIEFFEVLSIYKRCMEILSINEYERLIDSIISALHAEVKAKKVLFWFSGPDAEKDNWKVIGSCGEINQEDKILPVNDPQWKENIATGTPFFSKTVRKNTFFVPIMPDTKRMGVIEIYDKAGKGKFNSKDLKVAGIIAEFSQVALNNVNRLKSFEKSAFEDEDLDIFNHSFFRNFLKKEIFLSIRYKRPFSIVYIKITNLDSLRERFGGDVTRAGVDRLIGKVMNVIRSPDLMSQKELGEFHILLPETDYFGSLMATKRIEKGIAGEKYVSGGEVSMPIDLLIRPASFPRDGKDVESILRNVRQAAEASADSLFHRLDLSDKGLWESVDILLSDAARNMTALRENKGIKTGCKYSRFSKSFYSKLCNSLTDEIMLRPFLRGMLLLGMETVSPQADICRKIAGIKNQSTRVFVIGSRGREEWSMPTITPIYLKDGEGYVNIIFFLNEEGGYVFLGKENGQDKMDSFHSSDIYLVERLIYKLLDHYLLQWI